MIRIYDDEENVVFKLKCFNGSGISKTALDLTGATAVLNVADATGGDVDADTFTLTIADPVGGIMKAVVDGVDFAAGTKNAQVAVTLPDSSVLLSQIFQVTQAAAV